MSSEHEDAIQQISQPLMELFGDVHQPTECNCIAEAAEQVADWHLAQLQAAKAEAELKREIKIHDEYWHSQRLVSENGIGPVALANKEAAEMQLAQPTTPKEDKETE